MIQAASVETNQNKFIYRDSTAAIAAGRSPCRISHAACGSKYLPVLKIRSEPAIKTNAVGSCCDLAGRPNDGESQSSLKQV